MQILEAKNKNVRAMWWTRGALGVVLAASCVGAAHADQFLKPTPEELSMTSVPGYPGAAAVVLYREEVDRDEISTKQYYERVKILTEEGKKYANVELKFASVFDDGEGQGDSKSVESIVGRTIHADGTIIPFTGKPYLKTVQKMGGVQFKERVFTLPDVQVGSIIEYRYAERYENFVESPRWYLQGDLYVKSAHYTWYPTRHELQDSEGRTINSISWFPILPNGSSVVRHEMPASSPDGSGSGPQQVYDVVAKDMPPVLREDFMPPLESYSYRVLFSFSPYRTQQEYWAANGKNWSKHADSFMSGGSSLRDAAAKATAGANTPDEKLQKIYATIMALDNTEYSREHGQREDKAAGMGRISSVSDVLTHRRGSPQQLTELFVSMARAAGLQAYMGWVADRSDHLFTQMWMNIDQFDSPVAIVTVDGKDQFLDPGERYCPYGQLAWQHTLVRGLRQTEKGTDFFQTPGASPKINRITRVANLKLDEEGQASGKIDLTYTGSPALRWRQSALRGDDESVRHELRTALEGMVPKSMEVKVSSIDGLTEYDKPLAVHYEVSGGLGTPTGKRLMLPVDIFQASNVATFPHEKRELPLDFHYAQAVQDAVKVNLPANYSIEAVPDDAKAGIPNHTVYNMTVQQGQNFFVARRDYMSADVLVMPKEYGQTREFYSQFEAKDQGSIVLKPATAAATTAGVKAPGGSN